MATFKFLNEQRFITLAAGAWTDSPNAGTFSVLMAAERVANETFQSLRTRRTQNEKFVDVHGELMTIRDITLIVLREYADVESQLCRIKNGDPGWFMPFVADNDLDNAAARAAWNRRDDEQMP